MDVHVCIVDFLCVEHESGGWKLCPIEGVANDGVIETEGRGRMQSELVGATREGEQFDESCFFVSGKDVESGDGLLAELPIDHLSGTVVGIGAEGEREDAARGGEGTLQKGDVSFADGLLLEGLLQDFVRLGILGCKEEARRGLIQTMDQHEGKAARWITLLKPLLDIGQGGVLGGDAQHAGWFVEHDDVLVLINQGGGGIVRDGAFFRFGSALRHVGQQRTAFLDATGIELSVCATITSRAASIPEFGQSKRFELMLQGILQEAWCSTFARASRWQPSFGVAEDINHVAVFSLRVAEVEVLKDLELQGNTLLLARLLQVFKPLLDGGGGGLLA